MAGYPNTGAYFNPYVPNYPNYAQIQQMQNYQQMQQVQQQPQPQQNQNGSNGLPYVHGIEGAHAFPMPAGVNQIILWDDTVDYLLDFGANIAIPTDGTPAGTPGEISVAFSIDGGTDQASTMRVTPAALGEFFNVSRSKEIDIFSNCCQTITIRNTSDQPILVQEATLRITRPDLLYSR